MSMRIPFDPFNPQAPSRARVNPQQAPSGVSQLIVPGQDNVVTWTNVYRYPQPFQPVEGLQAKTLVYRLQAGTFYSAAGEELVVVSRIRWGNSNALNMSVVDIPSNSNRRIPLIASTLLVDVATILAYTPDTLTPSATGMAPDFFENIPAAMFRKAVAGAHLYQKLPVLDMGVVAGEAISQAGDELPQRQIIYNTTNPGPPIIPRPSGAENVTIFVPTGATFTAAQITQLFPAIDGYALPPVNGTKSKLATAALGVQVTSTGNALVAFDMGF